MFTSILTSTETTIGQFFICTVSSAAIGFIIALSYMFRSKYSKNFVSTLVLLPVIVQAVIMLVNGNVGTGVAVLGAFSLIRFRSVPGTSREIGAIFLAMASGLAAGMGHIAFAFTFTIIVCVIMIVLTVVNFGGKDKNISMLKVTVPEDLNYSEMFDDIFEKYTSKHTLVSAKTVDMGSLYEIRYEVMLKDEKQTKSMIDEIRCRNGNLTVVCGMPHTSQEEL